MSASTGSSGMYDDTATAKQRTRATPTATAPLHILIIGGLCLAQGLKKAGIGVAVHERDRSAQPVAP